MAKLVLTLSHAQAVTRRSVLGDGSQCFRTSKFTQLVTRLAPGVLLVTGIGYNSGECSPLITGELTRELRDAERLQAFVNLSQETGQASIAREWWAAWVKEHRPGLTTTHMFVRSKMMDMAISVLGMIIGGGMIQSHSSNDTFVAAIRERVPAFRSLPAFPDLPEQLP